jgi:hypothetical protein
MAPQSEAAPLGVEGKAESVEVCLSTKSTVRRQILCQPFLGLSYSPAMA